MLTNNNTELVKTEQHFDERDFHYYQKFASNSAEKTKSWDLVDMNVEKDPNLRIYFGSGIFFTPNGDILLKIKVPNSFYQYGKLFINVRVNESDKWDDFFVNEEIGIENWQDKPYFYVVNLSEHFHWKEEKTLNWNDIYQIDITLGDKTEDLLFDYDEPFEGGMYFWRLIINQPDRKEPIIIKAEEFNELEFNVETAFIFFQTNFSDPFYVNDYLSMRESRLKLQNINPFYKNDNEQLLFDLQLEQEYFEPNAARFEYPENYELPTSSNSSDNFRVKAKNIETIFHHNKTNFEPKNQDYFDIQKGSIYLDEYTKFNYQNLKQEISHKNDKEAFYGYQLPLSFSGPFRLQVSDVFSGPFPYNIFIEYDNISESAYSQFQKKYQLEIGNSSVKINNYDQIYKFNLSKKEDFISQDSFANVLGEFQIK